MNSHNPALRAWFEKGKTIANPQGQYNYFSEGFRKDITYHPWAWAGIGFLWERQGNLVGAEDALEKAVSITKLCPDVLVHLQLIREKLPAGNTQKAGGEVHQVQDQETENPPPQSSPSKADPQETERLRENRVEQEERDKHADEMIQKVINIEASFSSEHLHQLMQERGLHASFIASATDGTRPLLEFVGAYIRRTARDPAFPFEQHGLRFDDGNSYESGTVGNMTWFGNRSSHPDSMEIFDRSGKKITAIHVPGPHLSPWELRLMNGLAMVTHAPHLLLAIDLFQDVAKQLQDLPLFALAKLRPTQPHLVFLNYESIPAEKRAETLLNVEHEVSTVIKDQDKELFLRAVFPTSIYAPEGSNAHQLNEIFADYLLQLAQSPCEQSAKFTLNWKAPVEVRTILQAEHLPPHLMKLKFE